MDTLVVVLIVVAVVGFVLWRVGALKSLIDKKPSALEPAPVLPPVDVVPPPTWVTPSGPGTGTPTISRPLSQFEMLVAQGLDLETITRRVGRALTPEELAYARAHNVPGSAVVAQGPVAGITVDRKFVRNLSGAEGNMGHAEGGAESAHDFYVKEPAGSNVEITTGMTQSTLGACDVVEIFGPGQYAKGSFNAQAKIEFKATGDTQHVRVVLGKPGCVAVQRNEARKLA